ncbi:FMN-dependent dehydrogenase [Cupriavidus necator]|uniref:Alpha-hydroxy-acid oxidizing protein n=1 Tax=Cupriavidus necator (strain ATCC 17699 / DSM 428 / KCTC 22496 / NCIMB 10442 / H16 / Stanier 337) TaxID=381666 RepID=Q0K060_CUPNH|nr:MULTISPECIES: alpha-hydroxy acid oxidase [Cupriavidus]EON20720.1 L-mandelate dehydrogenase [Cupriavidus sp. GA3-3]QCC04438.1 alpha-hydroxy-acid oxidizing protein [Cupriavidus necator H16]QQB79128.1 alpha-hydroxy-acid oxidizing protein [Cupriavidus necator]WKA43347.1 alpha-hydroxy acid oxidase [Cupriavidus necator]CAJ96614.1 L-Mandelate dehydrogenase [Cupriavidus necator H16]
MLPAIKDYRDLARRRLSRFAFDYLEGGAEDGRTLARNLAAYQALLFRPRVLRDVTETDPGMEIFGRKYRLPLLVGPTGLNGLYWPKAEEALARAAHAEGLPFVMSTASTSLIEDVRAASDGDLWLQLYVQRDRAIAESMMARARAAGFSTLMLTVDTMVHGKRDHDIRNGFRMPVPWTPRLLADLAAHPRWCLRMLRQGGSPQLVNLARSSGMANDLKAQAAGLSRQMDMSLCWDDIAWLRRHWHGPVIIKGILTPADAEIAARQGLDGIVVSNHGGRQLEGAPSAVEMLPAIVAAAGGMHVFVDGGVRRGADIAKALAMGARGVLVGRAPLYGLAARGPRGVAEVLAILRGEFETTLRLLGVPQAARLDAAALSDDHAARLAAL